MNRSDCLTDILLLPLNAEDPLSCTSCLSGKYSHMLQSTDLFFHLVYFLLENEIL